MGENGILQTVEVLEKDGTRTVLNISSYESLTDGYTYFYTSYGTNRAKSSDITMIRVLGAKYNVVAEICGKIVGGTVVWYVKKMFVSYAESICPSTNPAIKWIWKQTAKVGAWGVGLVADRLTVNAVQETVQPLFDLSKVAVNACKDVFNAIKNHTNEEPQMKEVFEENTNNN